MEKYPFWIIDIRGNGGGADQCLQALLPYLYTDTMWSDILDIYVTPENIARHSETLKMMESNASGWSPNTISSWKAENTRLQQAEPFTYLPRGANKRVPYVFKEVKTSPKKVVIVYDGGSASSAETLIFAGMQSGKVITFGENSFGATGYGEVSNLTLPGGMYQLNIPLTRYRYQGKYDTVGIPPMIQAKSGKDWIEQALELFSQ
jgi:C-terminal processing protease CtpA/Prc